MSGGVLGYYWASLGAYISLANIDQVLKQTELVGDEQREVALLPNVEAHRSLSKSYKF